jgi:uncharacterized membrane protein YkgB
VVPYGSIYFAAVTFMSTVSFLFTPSETFFRSKSFANLLVDIAAIL